MRAATHASIPLLAALLIGCPNDTPEPGPDTGTQEDTGQDARADAAPDATPDAAPDAAPPADPITVDAGEWAVTVDFAQRSFTWGAPGEEPLVRLPADAIQLGEVPELEDDLSYDPYPFLVESLGRPPRLSGWRALTSLAPSVEPGGPGEVVLRATFEGGHGATLTLSSGGDGRASPRQARRERVRAEGPDEIYFTMKVGDAEETEIGRTRIVLKDEPVTDQHD